ncbi:GNAT family N-acetyltransferase [Nonomuraea terrae]|uniref:GNAT family N-acetyltransferase n=1 Tax=Nonomuraea terrae TaxID=2530383 RepID=UPI0037A6A0C1
MTVVLSVKATASAPALRLRPWQADDAAALARAHRDPVLRRRLTTFVTTEADARRWIAAQHEAWAAATRFSFAVLEAVSGGEAGETGLGQEAAREPPGKTGPRGLAEVRSGSNAEIGAEAGVGFGSGGRKVGGGEGIGSVRLAGQVVLKTGAEPGVAEVGYWMSAEIRGRGVASRALEAVTRWAFSAQGPLRLARIELFHVADNHGSCRVAERCGYGFQRVLPPQPPVFPTEGHLHVRHAGADGEHRHRW